MSQGLLFLVLFFSILPSGIFQSNTVWGTRPLLSYFALTASLETPFRLGIGLSPADFSVVQMIANEEAKSLHGLMIDSNRLINDPMMTRQEKVARIEAMGFNRRVDLIIDYTDFQLRQKLSPMIYRRLVNWVEKRWLEEQKKHGTDSVATWNKNQTNVRSYEVFATRYESKGGAYTVALPDQCLKFSNGGLKTCSEKGYQPGAGYSVAISYKKGVGVLVGEAGPWNIDDNYWASAVDPQPRRMFADLPLGLPEAQAAYFNGYNGGKDQYGRKVTAPFAIDLAFQVADDIGLPPKKNDWITVSYLWTSDWGGKFVNPAPVGQDTAEPAETPGGALKPTSNNIPLIETSTPAEDGSITHTVKAGETLWTIAVAYKLPVAQIQFLNNMGATIVIYEGQKIRIKEAGPAWTSIPGTETLKTQDKATVLTSEAPQEGIVLTRTPPEQISTPNPEQDELTNATVSNTDGSKTPTGTLEPMEEGDDRLIEFTDQSLLVGALVLAGAGVLLFGLGWFFNTRAGKKE